MFVPNRELGDFLLDARLMSRAELSRAQGDADEEGKNLFENLRMHAIVPEDELTRAAAHVLGVPFLPAAYEEIQPEALMLVPEPLARAHSVALIKIDGHTALALMLDLDALAHLDYLEAEQHLHVVPHLTDRASIKRALLIHQKHLKDRYAHKLKASSGEEALEALLSHARLSRASEVYLEEGASDMRVRYRIAGSVHDAMHLSSQAQSLVGMLKELARLSFTLNAPQEGRFKIVLKSGEVLRVGVSLLHASAGESLRLHLTSEQTSRHGFTLGALGLHGESVEAIHTVLARSTGLVLVAAPQGGGKTTALYTMLDLGSHPGALAMSVEEHIELVFPSVTQVEVRKDLGQTLASSLRAALRHNPDILLISDIKDEEAATLAASAASRGTLVLAGIKAPSASKAIQKMLTLGVDPLLLSSVLSAAASSRVVRKLCPHCRQAHTISRADIAPLEDRANFGRVLAALKAEEVVGPAVQWKDVQFYTAVGCEQCDAGYKGTAAIFEVLPVSAITKELIVSKKEEETVFDREVPLNLIEDGLFKAAEGITTLEEVAKALGE